MAAEAALSAMLHLPSSAHPPLYYCALLGARAARARAPPRQGLQAAPICPARHGTSPF